MNPDTWRFTNLEKYKESQMALSLFARLLDSSDWGSEQFSVGRFGVGRFGADISEHGLFGAETFCCMDIFV